MGARNRAMRATDFNAHSSRSHAVLQIWVEQRGLTALTDRQGDLQNSLTGRKGDLQASLTGSQRMSGRRTAAATRLSRSSSGSSGGRRPAASASNGSSSGGSFGSSGATVVRSKLTFVDLAGSERWGARHTEAVGAFDRGLIGELTGINMSLSALTLVVSALTSSTPVKHIPYR